MSTLRVKTKIFALAITIAIVSAIGSSLFWGSHPTKDDKAITAFISPDCSFEVISQALDCASSEIYVAMYALTSLRLIDKMAKAAAAGTDVKVLLEWDVVGESRLEKEKKLSLFHHLWDLGGEVRFLEETDYSLFHAKFAILDSETVLITSDNWVEYGVPQDRSYGNRGWGISIKDAPFAEEMRGRFFEEWEKGTTDWIDYIKETSQGFPLISIEGGHISNFSPMCYDLESPPEFFLSPFPYENSLIDEISQADQSIHVEQQTLKLNWGEEESPYIRALKEAAERGCEVRILLDGSPYNALENQKTLNHLNGWAGEYDLETRLFDQGPLRMLHNKGMVIDGRKVVISSMNWNTACQMNRDITLVLEGEIADYFEDVFLNDWDLEWDYHMELDMSHRNRGIYSFERIRRELWLNSIHCKISPTWDVQSQIFLISDPRIGITDGEREILRKFMDRGGTLIMTSFSEDDSGYEMLNICLEELGSSMVFADDAFCGYVPTSLAGEKITMLCPRAIDPGDGEILCEWDHSVLGAHEGNIYLFGSSFFVDPQNFYGTQKFFSSLL